jgi:glycosyltransferase involved in cell wall biosynthesis
MGNLARSARPLTATNGAAVSDRRLKVLWISQNLPYPPKTGVLQRNYNLLREASKFADVHLVGIVKQDILPGFDAEVATRALQEFCARVETVRLPIEESRVRFLAVALRSLFTEAPFTVNWATSPVLRAAVERAVAEGPHDLVYFDTVSLVGYRHVVGNVAMVLNHHNIESHLFERRIAYEGNALWRFYFSLEATKLRRCEAAVASDFDTNLVVSALDGARLQAACPRASTFVVANGVDVDYFRSATATAEPGHLIMVSGMNWFPNRDAALVMIEKIWPALSDALPHLRLTIVGASPPPPVVDLAARDTRVTVTGFVDDVRPHMERAQVYLCPMRDGGGTRLKILDALAMGKAIVATTMALEGIDVEPEKEVLVADTPDQFVGQVGRLVRNADLCRRLSVAGRSFVERHFAWPVIGDQMEQAFRAIVSARQMHD